MADIVFTPDNVREILRNKVVAIVGSSVQRGIYKDLILMIQDDRYLLPNELRAKSELSVCGDRRLQGEEVFVDEFWFKEVREFTHIEEDNTIIVRFYFLANSFDPFAEWAVGNASDMKADIFIVNSFLWGFMSNENLSDYFAKYIKATGELLHLMKTKLPLRCQVVWTTFPAVAHNLYLQETHPHWTQESVLRGNAIAKEIALSFNFDILDLHHIMEPYQNLHDPDGVHWNPEGHRIMTRLLLSHFCDQVVVHVPRPFRVRYRGMVRSDLLEYTPATKHRFLPEIN